MCPVRWPTGITGSSASILAHVHHRHTVLLMTSSVCCCRHCHCHCAACNIQMCTSACSAMLRCVQRDAPPTDADFEWAKDSYSATRRNVDTWAFFLTFRTRLWLLEQRWSYPGGYNGASTYRCYTLRCPPCRVLQHTARHQRCCLLGDSHSVDQIEGLRAVSEHPHRQIHACDVTFTEISHVWPCHITWPSAAAA